MNLYQIDSLFIGSKLSEEAMLGYVIANSSEMVYEYLKNEPTINNFRIINSWKDIEEENELIDIEDDNYNVIGQETFKDKCIRLNGELYFDNLSYEDAYYGLRYYGWTLIQENISEYDVEVLVRLNVATVIS